MNIQLRKAIAEDYRYIKPLFYSAFPKEERPPYCLLKKRAKQSRGDIYVALDGDKFVGFTSVIEYKDMVYLFYFAVDDRVRSKGYGSEILKKLKERFSDKRFFLAREQLSEDANNYHDRLRRHEFYLRNGFKDYKIKIKEGKLTYDVMGIGGEISAEEYDELITFWCGKLLRKLVDMRLIEE